MSFNIKIFLFCPIPEGQKPINEYINYKQNFVTSLLNSTEKEKNVMKWYFSIFFFVFSLLIVSHFSFSPLTFIFQNFFLTNIIILLFYLINFIKWKNLQKRFQESRIIYEEGSWYDSQIWEKPFLLIKNDKLLTYQKIEPILQRISRGLILLSYSNILLLILYLL